MKSNDLVPKNSIGFDKISNKLLKRLLPALVEPLELVFNKSLMEGIFPEAMKKADVTPLFKSKDTQDSNNYRPISLILQGLFVPFACVKGVCLPVYNKYAEGS